ncbi:diacylglycerol/lipid kinase family protein [Microbacterium sp. ASV49]|uniref:Diacylglycerol kinase family protein n=1 Tax=Microbacterium candidum TaxID=3041922 RepID=A0ABT7MVU9_9MICO|nr:diacylglycerol kinase family protein [Microbacterium sp. ASV49]MDL9978576.1 diacylglycerol kinase family protein [Microbacterium sp. ASV49]
MGDDSGRHKRAALVYNPIKVDKRRLRAAVVHHAKKAGWRHPLFFETTVDDLGDGVARDALDAEVDVVLVAGGDGTVRAVTETVAGSGVPLAIVPSGTGNLLARNLGLPLDDPEIMIAAAYAGRVAPTDVGIARITREGGDVEERAFVVMAGIGLDAAMIANTRPALKKSMGWVAYVDGAARSLPGAKPFRVIYELEEQRLHSAKVQSVLFANCGQLPAGIALIPDATIDDGVLDVMLIQPTGMFGWLGVWRKVWWDNSVLRRFRAGRRIVERRRDTSIRYLRGARMEVATTPPQPIELDGDEFGAGQSIRCRVEHGALLAVVP